MVQASRLAVLAFLASDVVAEPGSWHVNKVTSCYGKQLSLKKCKQEDCPRSCDPVNCKLGVWSAWSPPDCTGLCTRHRGTDVSNNECGTPCVGALIETKRCDTPCHKTAIDCKLEAWSVWEGCVKGQSQKSRSRKIGVDAKHGGTACKGVMEETDACPKPPPVNCSLNEWTPWSNCSVDCGSGQRTRSRDLEHEASNQGARCTGDTSETEPCDGTGQGCSLHVDCEWDRWTPWSACTCSCGGGQRTRDRHIKTSPKGDGTLCEPKDRTEMVPCNTGPCDKSHCVDGVWGQWGKFGNCSAACDGGVTWRSRQMTTEASSCGQPATGPDKEVKACNEHSCTPDRDCTLSSWTDWSDCTCSCDGVKRRVRRIDFYGAGKGLFCDGGTKEITGCNSCGKVQEPSEDCELAQWSGWTTCSATCGSGEHERRREVKAEAKHGGSPCGGRLAEVKQCKDEDCPVAPGPKPCKWGAWMAWGSCDKCGGQRKRNRQIEQMAEHGGVGCQLEASEETEKCKRQCHEPVSCEWGPWESRSDCSVPCGKGTKRRGRHLLARVHHGRLLLDSEDHKEYAVDATDSCDGEQIETIACEKPACQDLCTPISCKLDKWSAWSPCDCTGLSTRHRSTKQSNNECGAPCSGSLVETERCATTCHKPPINCEFSPWEKWEQCATDATQTSRTREITTDSDLHGGDACQGQTKQTKGCPKPGVVNCELAAWTLWADCSVSCGIGQRYRERNVHEATKTGDRCIADLKETESCSSGPCGHNRDCAWADWSEWGGCTCSCGGGQQTRDRFIQTSPLGEGLLCEVSDRTQIQPCSTAPCSEAVCVDGRWEDWNSWGKCTVGCGGGVHWRTRKIAEEASDCGMPAFGDDKEFQQCNTYSCTVDQDCVLAQWSPWSDCSCTQDGVKRRSRTIGSYGKGEGKWCQGHTKEIEGCNVPDADVSLPHVNCKLEDWSPWEACSVTCGLGQHERMRKVDVEAKNGGKMCTDPLAEVKQCDIHKCPVAPGPKPCEWGKWMGWGACDKCGGQRKRTRQILEMPEEGGEPCPPGASEETEACKRQCHAPVFCAWSAWEEEGGCSVTCGTGTIKRVRYLQARAKPTTLVEVNQKVNDDLEMDDKRRSREVWLSFAAGSLVTSACVMLGMVALRACRQGGRVAYAGVDAA